MWCHTVVRTDLKEGDWVRLIHRAAGRGIATQMTEVVRANGVVAERLIGGTGWAAGPEPGAGLWTIPAPVIPEPVDPDPPTEPTEPTDPPSTGGGSLPSFGSS